MEEEDCTVERRFSDGARRDVGGEMSSAMGAEASRLAVAGDDDRPSESAADAVPGPASSAMWSPSVSAPPASTSEAPAAPDWCVEDLAPSAERRLE